MADSKKKSKIIEKCVTPPGIFTYAWLAKPDNSEYGKGKYKCALRLEKGIKANDEFAKKLNALHKAAKGKADSRPAKDGDELAEDNEKKENLRGYWLITAKTQNKPKQVGADGKTELKDTARSGDFGRMAVGIAEYDTGANKGVTLYLNGIKLLERRAADDLGFDDESDEYEVDDREGETEDRSGDKDESSDDNSDF